jgi:hypothetical protein
MGFFDSFLGNSQSRDREAGYTASSAQREQGTAQGVASVRQGGADARAYYQPYAAQGGRANQLYGDATGANGQDAYRGAMSQYAGSDPFRQANDTYANNSLMRMNAARGMGNSGNSQLAVARAQTERGAQDWNAYLQRLQGQGQMGFQAAQGQANSSQNEGNLTGQMQYGNGQAGAQSTTDFYNAQAAGQNTGLQNLMGLGGMAMQAFAPGYGGQSAAGNMAGAASRGVNSLYGRFGG